MPGILLYHFLLCSPGTAYPTALGILLRLFDTSLLYLSPELQEDQTADREAISYCFPSVPQIQEQWFNPDCKEICICEGNNSIRCWPWKCKAQEACSHKEGILGCHAQGEQSGQDGR